MMRLNVNSIDTLNDGKMDIYGVVRYLDRNFA